MRNVRIEDVGAMRRFAAEYVGALPADGRAASVVALSGQLGAGKTTFVQALAKALGVDETVSSPTFVIEKIYALTGQKWQRLVHIDAYRLATADELRHLGWEGLVADGGNLILVEWPEHVKDAIEQGAHRVSIGTGEGDARTISYE